MKYDDVGWHHDYAQSDEACYTHIGFYFAWAARTGLAVEVTSNETERNRKRLLDRSKTPGRYASWIDLDKLTHHEFTEEGNQFSEHYYRTYLKDYENCFMSQFRKDRKPQPHSVRSKFSKSRDRLDERKRETYTSFYEVTDSWSNFDRVRAVLDQRLREWRSTRTRK